MAREHGGTRTSCPQAAREGPTCSPSSVGTSRKTPQGLISSCAQAHEKDIIFNIPQEGMQGTERSSCSKAVGHNEKGLLTTFGPPSERVCYLQLVVVLFFIFASGITVVLTEDRCHPHHCESKCDAPQLDG